MPIYEYLCQKCGHKFEKIQKFSDRLIKKCPECGGPVEQTITAPAVQFKGTGWYVTDYANKDGRDKSSSGSKESVRPRRKPNQRRRAIPGIPIPRRPKKLKTLKSLLGKRIKGIKRSEGIQNHQAGKQEEIGIAAPSTMTLVGVAAGLSGLRWKQNKTGFSP